LTYPEAIQYLYGLQMMGVKLGLDNMVRLCREMGHPERGLKFIHVAGTNGKGSVCALLASIFREAGYRTGLYSSPHLVHFRERIRLDGDMMSEDEMVEGVRRLKAVIEKLAGEGTQATFFEATTALAMEFFLQKSAEIVIWETGLGGRLDATNVVWPECTAITRLALDHEKILGDTLSKIAYEKSGIFKQGIPAVAMRSEPEAEMVLRARAEEAGTTLDWAEAVEALEPDRERCVQRFRWQGEVLETRLLGAHQLENLAVALAVCGKMKERGWKIGPDVLRRGVATAEWPARFQILRREPPLVLDGGHKPSGGEAALSNWRDFFGNRPGRCIFGVLADKTIDRMAGALDREDMEIWLVPVRSGRAISIELLRTVWQKAKVRVFESVADAWAEEGKQLCERGTLICGSLYLAGEVLALREKQADEVLLNG